MKTKTTCSRCAAFGFDLSTPLGIDKLNAMVYRTTGKNLVAHCKERLA